MSRNEDTTERGLRSVEDLGVEGLPPIRLVALILGLAVAIFATFL